MSNAPSKRKTFFASTRDSVPVAPAEAIVKRVKVNPQVTQHQILINDAPQDLSEDPLLKRYTWLVYDSQILVYRCRACWEGSFSNNWARGKTEAKPNRADEHISSADHLAATKSHLSTRMEETKQATIEETLAFSRKQIQDQEILSIFRNVYFIARSNAPISLLEGEEGLHRLTDLNNGSIHVHYRSRKQAAEILGFISDSIKEALLSRAKNSTFLAIEIDESTDSAKLSQLAICMRFVDEDGVQEGFFELMELPSATANEIYSRFHSFLQKHDLLEKLVALVTDGAPVVASTKEGVVGKFRKLIPELLGIHCMAHRVNLAMKDSVKAEKKLQSLHEMSYSLISFLRETNKRHNIFQNEAVAMQGLHLELIQPFDLFDGLRILKPLRGFLNYTHQSVGR